MKSRIAGRSGGAARSGETVCLVASLLSWFLTPDSYFMIAATVGEGSLSFFSLSIAVTTYK
jgi:hypothetical protein